MHAPKYLTILAMTAALVATSLSTALADAASGFGFYIGTYTELKAKASTTVLLMSTQETDSADPSCGNRKSDILGHAPG